LIFGQTYQHIKRYRQIVNIFIKYGFGYLMDKIGVVNVLPVGKKLYKDKLGYKKLTTPQKVKLMLEELGPTFIKLGQILSIRPDIIPREYIMELEKLQDNVPGFDYEKVKVQIEKELECSIDDVFLSFEKEPFAAASIAQAHRAVLENGQNVVVKVQRPNITGIIKTDLEILSHMAKLIEKHVPESRTYDPVGIVEEFAEAIKTELNFIREGWNIERFNKNFEGDPIIYIPRVYWDLTSQKVITVEYIEGIKVNQVEKISELGLSRKQIAENGARALMKQIFIHGFFHGDPHPGNILIKHDGKIAFIDFGMMGRIDEETKYKMVDLIFGVINKDTGKIVKVLLDIGVVSKTTDVRKLKLDVEDMLEHYYGRSLRQIKFSELINEMLHITSRYKVKLPSNFTMLCKSIITIEGIGRELDPDFNIIKTAKPFVKQLLQERYNLRNLMKVVNETLLELKKVSKTIPELVKEAYQKIKQDNIKIDFEYKGIEKAVFELNKMVNRLVFSMIVSSIIIGSSLIIQAKFGPYMYDVPLLGVFGFLAAGLLGIGLVISIWRSGKI